MNFRTAGFGELNSMNRTVGFILSVAISIVATAETVAQNIEVTDYDVEVYLDELGYFDAFDRKELFIDGNISGPTFGAIAAFAEDYGVEYDGIWTSPEIRAALADAVRKRRAENPDQIQQKMARIPVPPANALRFDKVEKRTHATVGVATQHDCSDGVFSLIIISEDGADLPAAGYVNTSLRYMFKYMSRACRQDRSLKTVFVVNPSGTYTGKAYLVDTGKLGWAFPYDRLSEKMISWLENDPGRPFAYIAPDFINLISGEWRENRLSIGGPTHMKSIFFNFSLADATLCPETVGQTTTVEVIRTETDENFVTTTSTQSFTFDKDNERLMVAILNEGNHIGSRLESFSRELISFYGCSSPEIMIMRDDLKAFAEEVL